MLVLVATVILFVGVGACVVAVADFKPVETTKEKVHYEEEEFSPLLTRRTGSPVRSESPAWEMV